MADTPTNATPGWLSGLTTLVATSGVAIGTIFSAVNLSHIPNAPAQPATNITAPLPALPASAQQSQSADTTQKVLLYAALAAGGAALLLSMRGSRR